MGSAVELKRIETDIPARMDRLPWARWHWLIVIGLGTVWILDGLEVTIVGAMSEALKSEDTGLGLTSSDVGLAGAVYVAGACLGALFFGQLTDRFGRKKLFMLTLGVYLVATVLTAFSMNPIWYFVARFFTGAGIGGEYAAINSAIDELIPAAYRGRIDVAINGSFWIGAAGGALLTIPLLNPTVIDQAYGWRLAFGLGAVLGVGVLLVRRYVPESPRWLFIHGREDEGERIVGEIEETVVDETGKSLPSVSETITIRQRKTIGLGLIAKTVFTTYPRRTILCFSLFIGQAFLYNAFFFTYGDTLTTFLGVSETGWYLAIFAASNFIGALALSPLFDSVGRVRMIAATYIVSGLLLGDRRLLPRLGDRSHAHRVRRGHLLLRLRRCELGLPDGQRGVPDGDARAVHRVLLRDRHRRWRDHRAAVVRQTDRERLCQWRHHGYRLRVLPRRGADDRRRDRGHLPGSQGRRPEPRVDRQAVDRRRRRTEPARSPRPCER